MIRRPPRSTQSRSSAASDVYKRQMQDILGGDGLAADARLGKGHVLGDARVQVMADHQHIEMLIHLSLIHISEPTRLLSISYAVFCLKKKKKHNTQTQSSVSIITHAIDVGKE